MRVVASLAALLLVLGAACGGGGDDGPRYDFESSVFSEVTIVPLGALRENRFTDPGEETLPASVIFNRLRELDPADPDDEPLISDWDTLLRIERNGNGEWRDLVRYFLAYEIAETPSSGECSVTIHVIEGLPFDPARPALASYTGTARIGDLDRNGDVIGVMGECIAEATEKAMDTLLAGGWFDPGWSSRPPEHG